MVTDMRWCPWERETLPADHACIAGSPAPMALTLDEIEAAYADSLDDFAVLGEHARTALGAVPELIARLRRAESELARWRDHNPPTGDRNV